MRYNECKDWLNRQKERFSNHIAKFTDYGNIKILDFANPESNEYRIRFLFEEDYYRLHISGDLGELTASNYRNMNYKDFYNSFANNSGYFEEKIDCHSRSLYYYDENACINDIKNYLEEYNLLDTLEDYEIDDLIDDVMIDFSDDRGIGPVGFDALHEIDSDCEWETVQNFGKQFTFIVDLYMLAYKLAYEQLNNLED